MRLSAGTLDTYDEVFDNNYFQLQKWLLQNIGLWPFETCRKKIFPRICCFIVFTSMLTPVVNGIYTFHGRDNSSFLECIVISIFLVTSIGLYCYIAWNSNKLQTMISIVAKNWILITDEAEHLIMEDFSKQGRTTSFIFGGLIIVALFFLEVVQPSVILVTSLITNQTLKRGMSVKGDYFIDQSVYYYELTIFCGIMHSLHAIIILTINNLFLSMTHQSFAFFKVVCYRTHAATKINKNNETHLQLVRAVRMHQNALQFVASLEDLCCPLMLWLIGIIIVLMSSTAAMILLTADIQDGLRYVIFNAIVFFHLFLISWPGQQLIDHSTDVFSCVYDCDWYLMSKENRKLFQILMLRSRKPSVLTAGGLYVLNYENLGIVLKTTFSYIALMGSAVKSFGFQVND